MYLCVCIHLCIDIEVDLDVRMYISILCTDALRNDAPHARREVHIYIYTYMHIYVCMHLCIDIDVDVDTDLHMCKYIYISCPRTDALRHDAPNARREVHRVLRRQLRYRYGYTYIYIYTYTYT